jgi:hypothetical protein
MATTPTVAYQAMVKLHDELMKVRGLAANSNVGGRMAKL